jgi:hypothetical protein
MQKLELFDETFDPFRTESYELSIQVSLNGFSFCIKDSTRNMFVALCNDKHEPPITNADDWTFFLTSLAKRHEWIEKPFKKVLFTYASQSFTLVPESFFEPKKAKQTLALTHYVNELDEIWNSKLNNEIISLFSIPTTLIGKWLNIHKNTKVFSPCHPSVSYYSKTQKPQNKEIILTYFQNFALVVYMNNGAIQHSGTIKLVNAEDTAYHLINICENIGFPPLETKLVALGSSSEKKSSNTFLSNFFKKVETGSSSNHFHYSYQLNPYKEEFANLFNLSLCE